MIDVFSMTSGELAALGLATLALIALALSTWVIVDWLRDIFSAYRDGIEKYHIIPDDRGDTQ